MGCGGSTSRVVSPELNSTKAQTDSSEESAAQSTLSQELSPEEGSKTATAEVEVVNEAINTNNNNNNAEVVAATKIQATYRGYATRKGLKDDNVFLSADETAKTTPTAETNTIDGDEEDSPPVVITTEPPDENAPPLQSALVKPNTPIKVGRRVTIDDEAQFLGEDNEDTNTSPSSPSPNQFLGEDNEDTNTSPSSPPPNQDTEAVPKEEMASEEENIDKQTVDKVEDETQSEN